MIAHRTTSGIGIRHLLAVAVAGMPLLCLGAEKAESVDWSARDIRGQAVQVPQAQRCSVLLFVKADQAQSKEALKQLAASAAQLDGAQVLVVLSGQDAAAQARNLGESGECPFALVADTDYSASGRMGVRVWPTTVMVRGSGEIFAHIAGIPKTYSRQLDGYLAFGQGRIDREALEKRLAGHEVVADNPEQIAARHLQVAQRLIEKGLSEQARAELEQGLKLHPESPALQLTLARAMLSLGDASGALKVLEAIKPAAAPQKQVDTLRGKALAQLEKWDQARDVLESAVRLNPDPAEAWYELGLVHQRQQDWPRAAEAFRHAFETSDSGRKLLPTTAPAGRPGERVETGK